MFLSFSFTGYPCVGFGFVFIANIADLIFASRHGLHKRESTISQCSLRLPRQITCAAPYIFAKYVKKYPTMPVPITATVLLR